MRDLILCYVDGPWAYFTTQSLSEQWGDDWNDAPYEHNAGLPYTFQEHDKKSGKAPWKIVKVAWDGALESPTEALPQSRFSVELINTGCVPWLLSPAWIKSPKVEIRAGVTLAQFRELILKSGGDVYEAAVRTIEAGL